MSRLSVALLFVVVMLITACSSQPAPSAAGAGNAANGEKLFLQATLGKDKVLGCATCHSVQPDKVLVGPSLAGIGTDAAGAFKEPGYKGTAKSAQEMLRESILDPNADITEGFKPDLMPKNFKDELTDQEVNDIVAYLLTLK